MHIHTLVWVMRTQFIDCSGCDLRLRFASYDEANHVHATGDFAENGPMIFGEGGGVAVPLDYVMGGIK